MAEKNINIPFIAFESVTTRLERSNKRLWILTLILTALLVITNISWIVYENQFVDYQLEIEAEQDGEVNIIGGRDVNYGSESESQGQE